VVCPHAATLKQLSAKQVELIPQSKEEISMTQPHDQCIEIATFKLKSGISDEALLALESRIRVGAIARQPGYLGRELGKDVDKGDWLMILRFDTRANMDAWLVAVKGVPEMREMGAMMEPGTMTVRFFARAEPATGDAAGTR
jgi:hypothetical protein